jgi:hypothetical protein
MILSLCTYAHLRGQFEKFVDLRQCVALMQKEAVTVIQSCSGDDNAVVV